MKMEVGQKQRIWENLSILQKVISHHLFIQIVEHFIFVSESSDYRWGAGDFDIFYTKQNEKTLIWEEPKNIGYPINSEEAEESLNS